MSSPSTSTDGDHQKRGSTYFTGQGIITLTSLLLSLSGLLVYLEHFTVIVASRCSIGIVIAAYLVHLWWRSHVVDTDEPQDTASKRQQTTSNAYAQKQQDTGYEGLGRGERTSLRGGVTRGEPSKQAHSPTSGSSSSAPAAPKDSTPQRSSKSKQTPQETPPQPRAPADSPRTTARKLVGTRLSTEQASKAAEKILSLQPYVSGKEIASLNSIWGFFDLEVPTGSSFEPSDPKIVKLKGNLNRQRLLLHPDKNGHPEAERTFKFLEQCHQRLTSVVISRNYRRNESVHERTRREEDELRAQEARKRKEEEDRKQREDQKAKEEDEKEEQRVREEEERNRRAEEERERLEAMVRDKEARQSQFEQRRRSAKCGKQSPEKPLNTDGTREAPMVSNTAGRPSALAPSQPVGQLTVHLLSAKDLPAQGFLFATGAYAKIRVGVQRVYSQPLPGNSPGWKRKFQFDVHRVDTALRIEVYREALGTSWGANLVEDELIGSVEIPFLDLQEWSDAPDNIVFGRPLEHDNPEKTNGSVLELQASLSWF